MSSQREHWQGVYRAKQASEVSWYQPHHRVSLDLIRRVAPGLDSHIIDVGGGASTLVDDLLDDNYRNLTVLDIAGAALTVAQDRLGERSAHVTWLEADILSAVLPGGVYDVWHDRAVFHFLTDPADRAAYIAKTRGSVKAGGHVIVASFAPDGPTHCSGLEVMRYSPGTMHAEFGEGFHLLDSTREDHHTPSGATQAFVYCLCRVSS